MIYEEREFLVCQSRSLRMNTRAMQGAPWRLLFSFPGGTTAWEEVLNC